MTERTFNPLQLLWLKEIGVHEIWGRALGSAAKRASKTEAKTAAAVKAGASGAVDTAVLAQKKEAATSAVERIKRTSSQPADSVSARHDHAGGRGRSLPESTSAAGKSAGGDAIDKSNIPDERIIHWLKSHESDAADLSALKTLLQECQACELHQHRDRIVFSHVPDEQLAQRDYFFIIDSPSKDDDATGLALEGPRGELFRNILKALNIDEQSVYVTPMVKCHPFIADLEDRHISACGELLAWQIEQVKPQFLIAFGETAGYLLKLQGKLSDWRYQELQYQSKTGFSCPVIATHDLRYMMVNQTLKAQVWQDLKRLFRNKPDSENPGPSN